MILYNVTLKIEKDSHEDWLHWMQEVHIPDVMNTGIFKDYKLCKILQQESDGVTYAIQYFCESMEQLNTYQEQYAPKLQKEHTERYGNKFVAFRTIMQVL